MIRSEWKQSGLAIPVLILAQVLFSTNARADCIGSSDRQNWSPCGSDSGGSSGGGGGGGGALSGGVSALIDLLSHPGPVTSPTRQLAIAYNHQAVAASNRGDWENAVKFLQTALRYDPTDAQIQKNLRASTARLLNQRAIVMADDNKDYAKAIKLYEEALQYEPSNGQIKRNLLLAQATIEAHAGEADLRNKDWDSAIEHLEKAQRIWGYDAVADGELYYARAGKSNAEARAAFAAGNYQSAIENYRQAIAATEKAEARFRSRLSDPHIGANVRSDLKGTLAAHEQLKARMQEAQERKIAAASSAYEQAKQANAHGGAANTAAQGVTEKFTSDLNEPAEIAKRQASIPFDRPATVDAGGNDAVSIPSWKPLSAEQEAKVPELSDLHKKIATYQSTLNDLQSKLNVERAKPQPDDMAVFELKDKMNKVEYQQKIAEKKYDGLRPPSFEEVPEK